MESYSQVMEAVFVASRPTACDDDDDTANQLAELKINKSILRRQ